MATVKLTSEDGLDYYFEFKSKEPSADELEAAQRTMRSDAAGTDSSFLGQGFDLPDMSSPSVQIDPVADDDEPPGFLDRTYGALKSSLAGTAGGLLNLPTAITSTFASDSYAPALNLKVGETAEDVVPGEYNYTFDTYLPSGGGRFEITEYGDVIEQASGRRVVSPLVAGQAYLGDVQAETQEEYEPTSIDSALDALSGGNPLPMLSFAAEQGIGNTPNLALAMYSFPTMVASISGNIAQERANNRAIALVEQGVSPEAAAAQARTTAEDLAIAIGVAVPEVLLERAGARALGFLDGDTFAPGVLAGAGRGLLTEAGTEALQEASQTFAEQVGTRDAGILGVDPASVGKRALGGALAGGFLGGAVGGFRGYRPTDGSPVVEDPSPQTEAVVPDFSPQQVAIPPVVEEQPVAAPTPARPVEPRLPPVEQTTALVDESAAVEEDVPAPAPSRRQTRERAEGAVEAGTRTELYEIEPQVQEGPVRQPVPRRQRRSPVEGDVDTADATDGELIVQDLIEPETRDEKADDGSYTNLMEDSNPEIPNPDAELDAKSLKEELNKELAEQKRRVDKAVDDVVNVELDPARVARQLDEMGEAVERLGQGSGQVDLRSEAEIESEMAIVEAIQQLNKEGLSTAEIVQKILAVHASEVGRSEVVPTTDTERFALQEQYSGPVFERVLRDLGKTDEEIEAMTTTERIGFVRATEEAREQGLLPIRREGEDAGIDIDGDTGLKIPDAMLALTGNVATKQQQPTYVEMMAMLNTIPRLDARREALVQEAARLETKRNKDGKLAKSDQARFDRVKLEHDSIMSSLAALLSAARSGKSNAARIMRATQFVVNSNGDLASAMAEATLRNNGPLSPKQKEKLTTLWNKHKKLYDEGKVDLERLNKEYESRREELEKAQGEIGERISDAKEINRLITEVNKGLEAVKKTAKKVQAKKKRKKKDKDAKAKKKPAEKKDKEEDALVSELTRQQKRLEKLIDRLNSKAKKKEKKEEVKQPTEKKSKRPTRRRRPISVSTKKRKLPLTPEQAALREAVELERRANRSTSEAKKRERRIVLNDRRNSAKRKKLESSSKKARDAAAKKKSDVRRARRRMAESVDAALMSGFGRGFRTFYGTSLVVNASTDLSMFGRQGALLVADDLVKAKDAGDKAWRARGQGKSRGAGFRKSVRSTSDIQNGRGPV